MASSPGDRDFLPTATWETLKQRAQLLQRLRQFFENRGFVEVDTPLLSHDSVVDLHIDPVSVTLLDDPRAAHVGRPMWLQTSPEFAMKRLLAAGAEKIYQITKAFRAGERGTHHNPEFTIVEWYRVGDDMPQGIELLAELARELLAAKSVDLISYQQAFERFVGINPHQASVTELARKSDSLNLNPPAGLAERDAWLNFLLASCVEPQLGIDRPVIVRLPSQPSGISANAMRRRDYQPRSGRTF
jgi:lysyl-tRNA synthetase class 2